jgi:hypothetical protein
MGGQACVFYGAAQVSKDVDLALFTEPPKIEALRLALKNPAAQPDWIRFWLGECQLEAMRFEEARKKRSET